jgi:UDP-N-acetylmuramate dehydrogenase
VSDDGVRGMVLRIRRVLDAIELESTDSVAAGAGASFPAVARKAASAGLAGIEFAAGIPGTIGGAIVMNAGWHEHEIGNHVYRVEYVDAEGNVHRMGHSACEFEYRRSVFRGRRGVVLAVGLRLEPGDPEQIRSRLERFAASRKSNQPTELPSCGSVFLKPEGDFAGRLIEEAGLKGLRVGDIEVSTKHANFFVNLGRGRAADVLELVERVRRTVRNKFDVELRREFELW